MSQRIWEDTHVTVTQKQLSLKWFPCSSTTRTQKLGGWWIIPWTKALAAHLSSKPVKQKGKKGHGNCGIGSSYETNVIHKNPLRAFQIQFIIMKKFVVCNVDWLVWMMSMPHDAVIVYTSNRQDISGHDSTNRSELCVMTMPSICFYDEGLLKQE